MGSGQSLDLLLIVRLLYEQLVAATAISALEGGEFGRDQILLPRLDQCQGDPRRIECIKGLTQLDHEGRW